VYDLETAGRYREKLQAFPVAYDASGGLRRYSDNVDCGQPGFFDEDTFRKGVRVWYKPPRFGRR